jgi:hypothetical protein
MRSAFSVQRSAFRGNVSACRRSSIVLVLVIVLVFPFSVQRLAFFDRARPRRRRRAPVDRLLVCAAPER